MSKVKIDKSLVGPMAADPNARAIVRSVIDLAHNLDLRTVAEGVEDDRTLELLTDLGCDFIQGHHLSRPIPAVEVAAWLSARTGSVRSA
jgi:EAL domain-containing protein (putative c-di-GMP-specific phosphodiesterase class I)